LPIEDDRGFERESKEALRDLVDQRRVGGSRIPEISERREAINIMLSMPVGTKAEFLQSAAREFAKVELANHRYVMVLHTRQANPHVHLSVRAEGRDGQRLNPRKEDLRRLARDLRRATAWLGHRGRGVVSGHAWDAASQRAGVGAQDSGPARAAPPPGQRSCRVASASKPCRRGSK
jgi:hypothetical protein